MKQGAYDVSKRDREKKNPKSKRFASLFHIRIHKHIAFESPEDVSKIINEIHITFQFARCERKVIPLAVSNFSCMMTN